MRTLPAILLAIATAGATAVLAFGELSHWRASHRRVGYGTSAGQREAIVVLGFKNRGTRANYMNRYRVRAALRSIDPEARESVLIFCGGPVGGEIPEAQLMTEYAHTIRGHSGPTLLDATSRSTWENIQNAIPLIGDADSIKIVSNSLHAEKGRAYLWQVRPDLARRLRRGADYRLGEILFVKPLAALIGRKNLRSIPPSQN